MRTRFYGFRAGGRRRNSHQALGLPWTGSAGLVGFQCLEVWALCKI